MTKTIWIWQCLKKDDITKEYELFSWGIDKESVEMSVEKVVPENHSSVDRNLSEMQKYLDKTHGKGIYKFDYTSRDIELPFPNLDAPLESIIKPLTSLTEHIASLNKSLNKFADYIKSHESDIAQGIDDFGELRENFICLMGREPKVEEPKKEVCPNCGEVMENPFDDKHYIEGYTPDDFEGYVCKKKINVGDKIKCITADSSTFLKEGKIYNCLEIHRAFGIGSVKVSGSNTLWGIERFEKVN